MNEFSATNHLRHPVDFKGLMRDSLLWQMTTPKSRLGF
jgi:hypothetical protein